MPVVRQDSGGVGYYAYSGYLACEALQQETKTIGEFYAKFCDLAYQAFTIGSEYSNSKLVRKVIRSSPERFNIKVTTIKEAKDIDFMRIDKLIGSLQTFEINLEEAKKGKPKSEKNITFHMVEKVPTKQSIIIKKMQEQLAILTQGFNKMEKK
ncbi:hypothetical protein Gotur_014053 [Gossypium turneri]